jgi:hypothetical protein
VEDLYREQGKVFAIEQFWSYVDELEEATLADLSQEEEE